MLVILFNELNFDFICLVMNVWILFVLVRFIFGMMFISIIVLVMFGESFFVSSIVVNLFKEVFISVGCLGRLCSIFWILLVKLIN